MTPDPTDVTPVVPARVRVFDTTLRDGEQSPGASLMPQEKLEIAHQLVRLGVDVIEAGFPVSSPAQFEAVQRIAAEEPGAVICGLSRAMELDIDAAVRALAPAPRRRVHIFIGTSQIHVQAKFGADRYGATLADKQATVIRLGVNAIRQALAGGCEVEFSPEDAGRTDIGFLTEVVHAAREAGATILNIPDTTGFCLPEEYAARITHLLAHVPGLTGEMLSVHCHNDLGLAVANSIAALSAGARQVECTINGIGERAGNASLEEIVMALRVRESVLGLTTGIKAEELMRTSRLVSHRTGLMVQANKAIVGANAFAHEAGIHQDGFLKDRQTYEIMDPATVGLSASKIVLGRHSGRHGVKSRLEALGYSVTEAELRQVYEQFLLLADRKKEVFDEDLIALMEDELRPVSAGAMYELASFQSMLGSELVPSATVRVLIGPDKTPVQESAWGDGPVDAICKAIDRATGRQTLLESYTLRSVTSGRDALGEVTIRLRSADAPDGPQAVGHGASTDVVQASAKAYIDALNRLAAREAVLAHGVETLVARAV